jgi:hypothetical protein
MKLHSSKFLFLLFVKLAFGNLTFAQNSTGINNPNPNNKASLDIRTTSGFKQGFLMPRLTGADTTSIGATKGQDHGLMFFDTLIGDVRFWDGNKWKGGGGNGNASSIWSKTGKSIFQSTLTDNVGIGTISPSEALEVNGNIALSEGLSRSIYLNARSTNTNGGQLTIKAGDAGPGSFAFVGGHLILQAGTGYNSSVPGFRGGNVYIKSGTNSIAGVNNGGDIFFQTGGPANTFIDRMSILENGNVGIGTTSPKNLLHIFNNIKRSCDRILYSRCRKLVCRTKWTRKFHYKQSRSRK